jgi:type IV secretion system protein VirB3
MNHDAAQHGEALPAVDALVLGITRPATVWGVSYPLFVLSIVATAVAFLGSDNLIALAAFIPLHAIGFALCRRDPRHFEILLRRFRLCPPVPNRSYWRCNCYEPD